MKAIILAAGIGSRMKPLTNDKPKCMVKLLDETLVERQIKIFHSCDINDITIVTGYKSEVIDVPNVNYVNNANYEMTNMNESLFCALKQSDSPVLVTYGDIVFERKIWLILFGEPIATIVSIVDAACTNLQPTEIFHCRQVR